jgi:hypothetical protein
MRALGYELLGVDLGFGSGHGIDMVYKRGTSYAVLEGKASGRPSRLSMTPGHPLRQDGDELPRRRPCRLHVDVARRLRTAPSPVAAGGW